MTNRFSQSIDAEVVRIRIAQLIINDLLKKREFSVPVHLALGHEAIAAAVSGSMRESDALFCTHRNIHYNLARSKSFRAEVDELRLVPSGLCGGSMGSMNMRNPAQGIIYTSSILGNTVCVAAGAALAARLEGNGDAVFAITGDGAIEEGAFYESLLLAKSVAAPLILIVENNDWSLATRSHERRCPIDLSKIASAMNVPFEAFSGNDSAAYLERLISIRADAVNRRQPAIVEVSLTTLGSWNMEMTGFPDGKFINYHHGAAPEVTLNDRPVLSEDDSDPIFVLERTAGAETVARISRIVRSDLEEQLL